MTVKKPTPQTEENTRNAKALQALQQFEDEKGGFKDAGLLEPTRYGPHDWDVKGRCSDF